MHWIACAHSAYVCMYSTWCTCARVCEGISAGISSQACTSLPLLNLLHRCGGTHVIGGSQFDGPWHSQRSEERDDSFPTRAFYWRGERKHEKEKKESCRLSEAVNGDFVSLPHVLFFSSSRIKALLNSIQNQHVWPCHEERQPCYLFLS